MDGHAVQAEAGMQGRLSFFIQMLPRGKFWLEVADEKLTSSIMRTFLSLWCLCTI